MYAERFPIQWPAGIYGIPITHLGQLGLKIDDLDFHPRNGDELLTRYEHQPDKHVILSADSGDPARDKAAVLYGKTTIQNGTGPYAHKLPVAPNNPQWLGGAYNALLSKGIGAHDGEVIADDGQQPMQATGGWEGDSLPGYDEWKTHDPAQDRPLACPHCQGNGCDRCNGTGIHPDAHHEPTDSDDWDGVAPPELDWGHGWQHEGGWKLADMSTGVQMQPGQQPLGGTCPNCGSPLGALAQSSGVCPTCKTMTSQQGGTTQQSPAGPATTQVMPAPHQPPPGMSPRDPARMNIAKVGSIPEASDGVRDEMDYTKFHIADVAPTDNSVSAQPVPSEEPGTNDGPFNDTGDVSGLSTDQKGAFQKAVNTAIDLLNTAAQQGLPLDVASVSAQLAEQGFHESQQAAAYALQQPTDESGIRSYPANNNPVPDPSGVGQGAQPSAIGGGAQDQVVSPMEQPSNGAFAHVKLPNGKVGHVTDTYDDMWGTGWVRVADADGGTHNVLAEQVEPVEAPSQADPVSELQAFIDAWPTPQGTVSGVQDHLARIRTARQYISRQMRNPALSHNEKTALDKIDAELQYASIASGQAVIERSDREQEYINGLVNARYHKGFAPTESIGGVSVGAGLDLPQDVPVVAPSNLERVHEEHPEVLVDAMTSSVRKDISAVTIRATAHIDSYTAGYPEDIRADHRQRFIMATQDAAAAYHESATPTTKTAAAEPSDWDGPVEAIFMGSL